MYKSIDVTTSALFASKKWHHYQDIVGVKCLKSNVNTLEISIGSKKEPLCGLHGLHVFAGLN